MAGGDLCKIVHFVWDFDGTFFDTYPVTIGFLRSALRDFGFDCDPDEAMGFMLDTIAFAQQQYARRFGIEQAALAERYLYYHRERTPLMLSEPFPGAREVLARICEKGGSNYIFTQRDDGETARYLEKFGFSDYFREIVGAASPHFVSKPSPTSVLYLADKYGMTAENAVMVGDRECDLESGRAAGIRTVQKICPVAPRQLSCDWRFETFDRLLEQI